MCEISEISGRDVDIFDWNSSIDEKDISIAELNGRKREMTVMKNNGTLPSSIFKPAAHGHSFENRNLSQEFYEKRRTEVTAQVELKYEWDSNGGKMSGGGSVEIKDKKGNFVKAEVQKNSDGKGSAKASAGKKKSN